MIVLLVALVPVGYSYARALATPGNTSLAIRTVEWVRNNHGAFLVTTAENFWYTLEGPHQGGPPLHRLPRRTPSHPVASRTPLEVAPGLPRPTRIKPLVRPALAREGVWTPAGQVPGGRAPILETTLRPNPSYPTVVAGLAWIDTSRAHLVLVPGRTQPLSSFGPGVGEVPEKYRSGLLATFNSGFKTQDGHGGFVANGKTYVPPRRGLGTIAIYGDGKVNVGSWGSDIKPSPRIAYLRQNLPLIVDNGRPNPSVNDPSLWGTTVGNTVRVWRSGIGITSNGALVYAAGNGLTTYDLANVLVRGGAVRAMQLDINPYWVDFFTYAAPGGRAPSKLLPSMLRPMDRYLVPDDRDFFAILSTSTASRARVS